MKQKYQNNPIRIFASSAILLLCANQNLQAQLTTNRYWDPSSGGSFGSINNTTQWVSPLNIVWTNSTTGGSTRLQNYSTTTTDICNFGGPTAALGGGTIPVGTVNAGWLSFNTISGSGVTLSGGTITLNAAAKIIVNNTTFNHTISSTLAGAATSLAKEGNGNIILSGSNTFTGNTTITAGTLTLANSNALLNSPLDTSSSISGSTTAGLKTTVSALTFGGLLGNKNLADLFTTTSGGFTSVNGITLNPRNGLTANYFGEISDGAVNMSITKNGQGTQVLSGTNTFTGQTVVNNGTLRLDYSTNDSSKLSDTGTLVLGNGIIDLSGGSHTEVVAATILSGNFSITRTSGTAKLALGEVTGSGNIDISADNIATTTSTNNALGFLPFATIGGGNLAANDGSGNIVTFSGYVDISARGPSTIPDNANALVRIVSDGTSGNIELAAPTTSINNLLQSNPNFAAIIDTTGKTFACNALTVGSDAESLSIGIASSDGSLRSLQSGGTLSLTCANPTGFLAVNASILDNTTASAVSTSGSGTIVIAGTNTYTGTTSANAGTLRLSGSLTGSTVLIAGTAILDQTSTGVISGNASISHNSNGNSILAGSNDYSGSTNITSGTLSIRNNSALGSTTEGTVIAAGAALLIQDSITVGEETLTLNGTGTGGTGALRSTNGNNVYSGPISLASDTSIATDAGSSLTLSNTGSLSGSTFSLIVGGAGNTTIDSNINITSGSITKQGTGTLTLTGSNSFTGSISVSSGVINLQNSSATGTTAGGVGVSSGAAVQLQGDITLGNEALTLVGTGVSNDGALRNISGSNTWGGLISLSVNTRFQSDAGNLIFNVSSGDAIAGTGVATSASSNVNMTFSGNGDFTVADPISSGSLGTGILTKTGTGTLTMQAANTYTGPTVISSGLIHLQNGQALRNSPLDTANSVAGDAANGLKTTATSLTIGGLIGNKNLADTFTTTSGGYENVTALTLNNALPRSYDGIIANGASGMTLTKTGAGIQTLNGVQTYTGATVITGGTLKLNGAASIANTANITVGSGAVLDISSLNNSLSLETFQTFSGSGTGANATGNITTLIQRDLNLSTGGISFPSYGGANGSNATNAPLTVIGTGELKLNGAPITVTTTSQLAAGTYVLVAKSGSALVTGTPGSLTVNGAGVSGNASIAVSGDQLVLTVTAAGYSSWQTTNSAAGALDSDHDNDGVSNGIEYFLAGPNGNSTGFTSLPNAITSSGVLTVTWLKGVGYSGIYGTDFVIETSTSLSEPWSSEISPGNVVDSPTSVIYTFPGGPNYTDKRFVRLKVTGP